MKFTLKFTFAAVAIAALFRVPAASAEMLDWCALGKSLTPDRAVVLLSRVRLQVEGAPLGDLAAALSQEIIRRRVWSGEVDSVHVSPYVREQCGPSDVATHLFELRLSASDVEGLRRELEHRGGGSTGPTVDAVTARAVAAPPLMEPGHQSVVYPEPAAVDPAPPPEGVPVPAMQYDWVRIYFATNRNATGEAASDKAFGSEDSDRIAWGSVDVSIPHTHKIGKIESPSIFKFEWVSDPAKHVALAPRLTMLTPEAWKGEVKARATALDGPGVLVFVHGYNVSFANGARRAAQFSYDIAFTGPTVYYSWPSDGALLPYMHDEAAAAAASELMGDVLQAVTGLAPGKPVYVVAHSMGNRVMLRGLEVLLLRDPKARRSLSQVVMAAPDVGRMEFKRMFANTLAGTNPRYTLYASANDKPVDLSEWLHGDARLGDGGPDIAVVDGLDSVDATAVTKRMFDLDHSYFGDTQSLLSDLIDLIHLGMEPSARKRLRATEGTHGRYWVFVP